MKKLFLILFLGIIVASCGRNQTEIPTEIAEESWVAVCNTNDIERIDYTLLSMSPENIIYIYEALVAEIKSSDINSSYTKEEYANAYLWLITGSVARKEKINFSDGQALKLSNLILEDSKTELPAVIEALLGNGVGDDALTEATKRYDEFVKQQ